MLLSARCRQVLEAALGIVVKERLVEGFSSSEKVRFGWCRFGLNDAFSSRSRVVFVAVASCEGKHQDDAEAKRATEHGM